MDSENKLIEDYKSLIMDAASYCTVKSRTDSKFIAAIPRLDLLTTGETAGEADMMLNFALKDFVQKLFAENDIEKVTSTLLLLKDNPERWDKELKMTGVDVDKDGNVDWHYNTCDTDFLNLMLMRFKELGNTKEIAKIQAELRARNN
jgi:hypothetical protein